MPGRSPRGHVESGRSAKPWSVLAVVAMGVFMATLDSSIVNISLPSMAQHFGVPLGGAIAWIVIGYLVVVAASLLTAGRLADMVGHRPVWIAGLVVFTLCSAACGFAPSLPALIAARALQGVGAALLMAISPALLTSAFPSSERGRALGMNSLFVALGVSAGPSLGGVLSERLSWRWIFFVNVPVGAIAIATALLVLSKRNPQRQGSRFDSAGAALLGVTLAAGTAALSFGNELGWLSPWVLGGFAVSIAALAVVVPLERVRPHALIDVSLFRDRAFVYSLAALVVSFFGLFATSFLMPFYLEELRGFDTEHAGLTMTALPATLAVAAPIGGMLSDRLGSRALCVAGMLLAAGGLVVLGNLSAGASITHVVLALVLVGAGQGLFQPANNSVLLGAAPPARRGVASGLLATGRVVGQSLSIAATGAIFAGFGAAAAGRALAQGAASELHEATFLRGFRAALMTNAGLAATAALLSLLRGKTNQAGRESPSLSPRRADPTRPPNMGTKSASLGVRSTVMLDRDQDDVDDRRARNVRGAARHEGQRRTVTSIAAVIAAVIVGLLGMVLVAFGQLPGLVLVLVAPFIAWYGKSKAAPVSGPRADVR